MKNLFSNFKGVFSTKSAESTNADSSNGTKEKNIFRRYFDALMDFIFG